ncbi:MAG TPA: hypothetical protein DC049_05415 [Spirochaetia bacterium]|nr:hypothetical protein [Spirochaetia bacterium]
MIAVKAVYDGHNVKLPDSIHIHKPQKVIITFLESDNSEDEQITEDIAQLTAKSKSFDFLKEEGEDIYSDSDLKVKY